MAKKKKSPVALPQGPVRINISISAADLKQIDKAAEAAGETRSGFLAAAALQRATCDENALTPRQRREVSKAVKEALEAL